MLSNCKKNHYYCKKCLLDLTTVHSKSIKFHSIPRSSILPQIFIAPSLRLLLWCFSEGASILIVQFPIQYSMGNSVNGKGEESYYQLQLSLFRWRADPNHNAHLPRVRFADRQQYLQKHRFGQRVEEQLQQHLFLDVDALKERTQLRAGEVIVFEQFAARLDELEGGLELGECIYAMVSLMEGYERIMGRIGKTHIELSYCFITPEGEVRAWLSDNPASNDLSEEAEEGRRVALYSSEAGVVKRLMELTRRLSSGSREFEKFWSQLRQFVKGNMLQNCNFAAVRRFINRYLFLYGVPLPFGLAKAMKRAKVVRFDSLPSEQEVGQAQASNIATRGQLSTYAQLDYLQPPPSPHERKSSSFTINPDPPHPCDTACRTPKADLKCSPLDSTFINSQMLLSCGKENKKGQSLHKSRNDVEKRECEGVVEKPSLAFLKKRKVAGTVSGKVSVKFHSRQPSYNQQESNSMMVSPSPANDQPDFGVHYSYTPAQVHHFPKQQQQREQFSQPASVDKLTSQLLGRQVSGLVSNKELSICESMGTFQSIENSKDSGYKGVLTKMGRTAKMLNFPTGKRLATFFRNNAENHPHTQ